MNNRLQNQGSKSVLCLKQLGQLPVDFTDPLLIQYPAMKLGVLPAVDFYLDALAERVGEIINASPSINKWVLTGPPLIKAPAAANLLCWRLYRHLQLRLSGRVILSMVDLHFLGTSEQIMDQQDFKLRYEYSNNSLEQRIKERSRLRDDIHLHEQDFSGNGVIVINDIRVTGTQQEHMNTSFGRVKPALIKWLYILEVENQLGINHPQIEHQINSSRFDTFDDFVELLTSADHRFTARCISRIFNYDTNDFFSLLSALSDQKRQSLYELAIGEGRFEGEFFADKFKLLKQQCSNTGRAYRGKQ